MKIKFFNIDIFDHILSSENILISKTSINENVNLIFVENDKFKSNVITCYFKRPLRREECTKNSLLPYVLKSSTKNYKTSLEINKYMQELYNANISANVDKIGTNHIISFRLSLVSDEFLPEKITHKAVALLKEIIFDPNVEDGGFSKKYVDIEKEVLREDIKSLINEKGRYALQKANEIMFEGEKFSIRSDGYIEDLESIDNKNLYEYYQKFIKTTPIDIVVAGDFDKDEITKQIKEFFDIKITADVQEMEGIHKFNGLKKVEEKMDIVQGKLVTGYSFMIEPDSDEFYDFVLYSEILGGGAYSKLFTEVREKNSLCYSIFSFVQKYKGTMMIMSGIEHENKNKVIDLTEIEMQKMKDMDISDKEMESAKKHYIYQLDTILDSLSAISDFYYAQSISPKPRTIEQIKQIVENITKEDIQNIAKKCKKELEFFLTKNSDDSDDSIKIFESKVLKEKVYNETLHNNMQVFVMPKKGFNKKYAVFATNYGSNILEFISPHTNKKIKVHEGIAHFLEHKMFEMPDGQNAFDEFSKYGADANAYTNFNMTAYLFSATNNFEEALKHLITYVQTPYFTDENVEKEKGIIAQEIKMYDDNPHWQVFFNCLKAMYKNHPNSIDIAGDVDSIYKITKQELYDCYNTFYSPSNMALFVVGDVDKDEIFKIVKETVKDENMFDGQVEIIYQNEEDKIAQKEIVKQLEVSIPMMSMGFKEKKSSVFSTYPRLKKEIEMELISQIIFKKGSKLNEKLYDSSIIFSPLDADYSCHKDYGYVTIEAQSRDLEKTKNIILEEIRKYKKDGVDKEEFERIKKQKIGTYIKLFDSVEGLSNVYLTMYFKDENLFDYYRYINEITVEDINNRINDIFDEKQMVMSIINPK